jgi:hypothetical protein
MGCQGLSHDADIGNAGLFDCVHHGGEGAEGNVFVGAYENRLMLRIANLGAQLSRDLIDVDRTVSQENALLLVNAEDQPLFRNFFHGTGLGYVDLDARLQNRGRDHENDQQH